MEKVIYERLYPSDGKKAIINFTISGVGREVLRDSDHDLVGAR